MKFLLAAVCFAALVAAQTAAIRTTGWDQIPGPARMLAAQLGINASNFDETLAGIDQRTAQRLLEGDWDHLIFYMLQSRSFTEADPIEPARSAADYMTRHRVAAPVSARIDAFLRVLKSPVNERQRYFATLLPVREQMEKEYARAMGFLYEKEVRCPDQACIAALYMDRGLSTDTSTQAFRVVEAAAGWIQHEHPEVKLRRVLILGPGVDLAPRTGLQEDSPPRVYQPGQIARLLHPQEVDCADINPLVLAYAKSACATTYQMNIATRFADAKPGWDLIVATNILLYLNDRELLLAMNNIRRMLNPGGMFVHNDTRFAAKLFGKASGLPAVHFGEIQLDSRLIDHYVIHQVAAPAL